jgi:hypothetical protein
LEVSIFQKPRADDRPSFSRNRRAIPDDSIGRRTPRRPRGFAPRPLEGPLTVQRKSWNVQKVLL